ncbi:RdgB/HAM1 family non-canonical purine NTP pyrophosphatase [Seleniivibrio woodruffii]|uniref:dITP/XTP pyrophosphatase n=1 Tax=Seleniivibrio woodruffii TaxID=1078050 RepID=A0A4R1KFI5_9BACT|nr:RdgB/HAM1 family non-canonical purine NTP pyrophosphatase [Seleniivibrio woodruffii]TCK62069.1 XTP/dITP diphosphohydrolase [Seleniivibrio woodruffii]TVZ34814.1 XTP/dITP diphosphohydrolase [Seleniivibrio woodruffii]
MRLYVATKNQHKLKEIGQILSGFEVVSAYDYIEEDMDVEETGRTFLQNASIKAKALSKLVDGYVIADDSGISVDALDGAPGVFSARFAGSKATDADNNNKLLAVMERVPDEARGASYICVIALAAGGNVERTFGGMCEGAVARDYKGEGGFGYDVIFLLPDGRHMAELTDEEKNAISHRNMALQLLKEYLDSKQDK